MSDDSARFEWNESEYVLYTSLTEAVAALGTDGGNIIVNGTYTHTTFSDTPNRKTVTFLGTGTDSVIALTSDSGPLTLNHGTAVFDDIRVSVEGVGKYIHGNGNLFVYVNKGAVYNVTANSLSTISGCRTVIFNNGLGTLSSMNEVPVSSQYQFIARSEIGGTVSVENENTTENPTFVLQPLDGKIPFVNGEPLTPDADGVYRYTPQEQGASVTIRVEWRTECILSFDLNGGSGSVPSNMPVIEKETVLLPSESDITRVALRFDRMRPMLITEPSTRYTDSMMSGTTFRLRILPKRFCRIRRVPMLWRKF